MWRRALALSLALVCFQGIQADSADLYAVQCAKVSHMMNVKSKFRCSSLDLFSLPSKVKQRGPKAKR